MGSLGLVVCGLRTQFHTLPGKQSLWGRTLETGSPSQAGCGMLGSWNGGPWLRLGFGPAPPVFWGVSYPEAVDAAGSTYGALQKGQVWVGPVVDDSIVLRGCPPFLPWALGEGAQKGTGPMAGVSSLGTGRVIEILIRRDGERRVRDGGGAGDGGENTRGHPWVVSRARSGVPTQSGVCAGFPGELS